MRARLEGLRDSGAIRYLLDSLHEFVGETQWGNDSRGIGLNGEMCTQAAEEAAMRQQQQRRRVRHFATRVKAPHADHFISQHKATTKFRRIIK